MLGRKRREQMELFVAGSLEQLIPEEHILFRVNRVLDHGWLRAEVADCYCGDNGRPGVDPEVALGGLPRRGEEPARTGEGGALRTCEHEDTLLPDGVCGQPQAARHRCSCEYMRPVEGLVRPEPPPARPSRPFTLRGLPRPRRVSRQPARSRNGVIQQSR